MQELNPANLSASRLSRGLLVIVAVLLWLAPEPTRAAMPDEDYKGEGLCRFALVEYQLPAKNEAAINRIVSEALKKHEKIFGFKAAEGFHVRIRIFGRFADFEGYTKTNAEKFAQSWQSLTNLGGYYSNRDRQVVTWRQRHPTLLANTLLHEASHAILHSAYRRIPIWLSEGSATYFAYPPGIQDQRDIGSLQYRWAKLNVLLRAKQLPATRTILNWTDPEWMGQDPGLTYTVSWSLFQLMMSTPPRQEILQRYLRELQQRGRGRNIDPAGILSSIYPGELAQLEKDWHGWIAKGGSRVLGPEMDELLKQVR